MMLFFSLLLMFFPYFLIHSFPCFRIFIPLCGAVFCPRKTGERDLLLLSDVYISAHELFALQKIGHMCRIDIGSKNLLANVFRNCRKRNN